MLHDALPTPIHSNTTVTSIHTCSNGQVILQTTTPPAQQHRHPPHQQHQQWVVDLVVGADGSGSIVRHTVMPGSNAKTYVGYVGWRGVLSEEKACPAVVELLGDVFTVCKV